MIGYIGLGAMGAALARRVLREHPLVVFDDNASAVRAFTEDGGVEAASARDLAARCDVVFLCLPTSDHVRDVLFGGGRMAEALRPGSVMVDQTSGDPNVTRELATRLGELGCAVVDAPVSGGPEGATAGTIAIMVGADSADFEVVRPILGCISPNIFYAGAVGAGHTMKLVNNVMSGTQRLLTFECLALATKNGIEIEDALNILLAGGARNAFLERVVGPAIVHGDAAPPFTLRLSHKDVRLACQLAADSGVPMLLGGVARELLQMCINEMGPDAKVDTAALVVERLANTQFVPSGHSLRD